MKRPDLRFLISPVLRLLAFGAAFAAACYGIRQFLPFPPVPAVQPKIEYLKAHINEFDTIFLGSSRMYHQIVPSLFDELMAKNGIRVRSFNLGVDGMRPPEDAYVFDEVRKMKPQNLRYVFIESAGLRMPVDKDKKGTIRAVYWHDWPRLKLLFQRAIHQKKKRNLEDTIQELREPMGDFLDHLELFAKNVTNAGRSDALTRYFRPGRMKTNYERALGDKLDGYISAGLGEEMTPEAFVSYRRELGERRAKPAVVDLGDPVSQRALERLLGVVRELGATPVLVIPPTTNKKNFHPRPDLRKGLLLMDYSDINKYAVLYEDRHRQDTDHVNTAGAVAFTHILAGEFAAVAKPAK